MSVLVATIIVIPIVALLLSWQVVDRDLFDHIFRYLLWESAKDTLLLVIVVTTLATVVGTITAWIVATFAFPGRNFIKYSAVLPLAFPKYVLGFVYLSIFDYSGEVQSVARHFHVDLSEYLQTGQLGLTAFALAASLFPYVYLFSLQAFQSQDRESIEMAHILGANLWQVAWRISLPRALPWILAGALLVALETLSDFGTVAILGYNSFTTLIYKTWYGLFSFQSAAQLSSIVAILALALIIINTRLAGAHAKYTNPGMDGSTPMLVHLSPRAALRFGFFPGAIVLVSVFVPLIKLLQLHWQAESVSLDWLPVANTIRLGMIVGVISLIIAFIPISFQRLQPSKLLGASLTLAKIGYGVPGTVLAVSIFYVLSYVDRVLLQNLSFGDRLFTGTVLATVLGLICRFYLLGHDQIQRGMMRIPRTLDEAAKSLGARSTRVVRDIHLPLLKFPALYAFLFVFIDTAKEMPITLMTRPFGWDSLATKIFELTSEGLFGAAALPSILLFAVGLVPVLLFWPYMDGAGSRIRRSDQVTHIFD